MLISGGPGTGKTVVALHRAAYLLYADRRRYETGGVLVIGPSGVFMRYIERVLPSLGETAVALRSLGEVVDGVRATRRDDPAVAEVKGSGRWPRCCGATARQAVPDAPDASSATSTATTCSSSAPATSAGCAASCSARAGATAAAARVASHPGRRAVAAGARRAGARARQGGLRRRRCSATTASSTSRRPGGRRSTPPRCSAGCATPSCSPGSARACSTAEDRVRLLARCLGATGPRTVGRGRPAARRAALPARRRARSRRRQRRGPDPLAHLSTPTLPELTTVADRELPGRGRRPPTNRTEDDGYAHVLVDEAQDLTPMQWRMVGRRGRGATWTVVGDPAQSSWPVPAEAAASPGRGPRGRRPAHDFHLSTNYRNSSEIYGFAADYADAGRPRRRPARRRALHRRRPARAHGGRPRGGRAGGGRRARRPPSRARSAIVVPVARRAAGPGAGSPAGRTRRGTPPGGDRGPARGADRPGHQGPGVRRHRRRRARTRSRPSRRPAGPRSTSSSPGPPSRWSRST